MAKKDIRGEKSGHEGKHDRQRGNQGHEGGKQKGGKQHHGGKQHQQQYQGQSKKREEIVPWGWETALKDERKKKAEAAAADAAARKAAREFDPGMQVKEKINHSEMSGKGKNGKKDFKPAPGGGAGPDA